MYCPHCKKDSPVARQCIHCGGKLKLTRKQVLKLARLEAQREQEAYTAKQVRKWLTFAGVLFAISLALFIMTRGTATPRVIPVYPYANPTPEAQTELPVDGVEHDAETDDGEATDEPAVRHEPRVFVDMRPEELVGRFPRLVRTDAEMAAEAADGEDD